MSSQHLVDRALHALHLDDELGDLVVALLDQRHRLPLGVPDGRREPLRALGALLGEHGRARLARVRVRVRDRVRLRVRVRVRLRVRVRARARVRATVRGRAGDYPMPLSL